MYPHPLMLAAAMLREAWSCWLALGMASAGSVLGVCVLGILPGYIMSSCLKFR